jgi:hypothetical protein
VRSIAMHIRGFDHNAEVNVVLGQLRDASDSISRSENQDRLVLASFAISAYQTPILNPAGVAGTLLNRGPVTVQQNGRVLFAERTTVPKLLAIVHRGFPVPAPDAQENTPLPYHVFLPPTVFWKDAEYPFGFDDTDFIARYVFEQRELDADTQPKAIANQCAVSGPKVISIFPVGNKDQQMGTLNSEDGLLRLLKEVNYFVQRMLGQPFPRQPVGPTALSCFSSGVRFLAKILQGARVPELHDSILRHIYLLDAAFALKAGGEDQASTDRFCNAVASWYRQGAGRRTIRSYTQSALYLQLGQQLPAASFTRAQGATELESSAGTVLHVPTGFWRGVFPVELQNASPMQVYNAVHQFISSTFLEHAVGQSDFSP